jgi:acyl-CoA thioester hydrolase
MLSLPTFSVIVHPWQCDVMGHLNTRFYAAMFDDASLQLLCSLATDCSGQLGWADVEWKLSYQKEVRAGACLKITSTILGIGNKSLAFRHEMTPVSADIIVAIAEIKVVRFDLAARKAVAVEDVVRDRVRSHQKSTLST